MEKHESLPGRIQSAFDLNPEERMLFWALVTALRHQSRPQDTLLMAVGDAVNRMVFVGTAQEEQSGSHTIVVRLRLLDISGNTVIQNFILALEDFKPVDSQNRSLYGKEVQLYGKGLDTIGYGCEAGEMYPIDEQYRFESLAEGIRVGFMNQALQSYWKTNRED